MLSGSVSELQTISIIVSDSCSTSLRMNRRLCPRVLPSLPGDASSTIELGIGTRFRHIAQDQAAGCPAPEGRIANWQSCFGQVKPQSGSSREWN
jgi:hypothetical protein